MLEDEVGTVPRPPPMASACSPTQPSDLDLMDSCDDCPEGSDKPAGLRPPHRAMAPPRPFQMGFVDLQERLEELATVVFGNSSHPIPGDKVRLQWADYLQLLVEPGGWFAIWKRKGVLAPGRDRCANIFLKEPLLVEVTKLDYENLRASVIPMNETPSCSKDNEKCQGTNDLQKNMDCSALPTTTDMLPDMDSPEVKQALERHQKIRIADLLDLYPTEMQPKGGPCAETIARALDLFRFFYSYIWYPWDEYDRCEDWTGTYLESRIQFLHDLDNGSIEQFVAHKIVKQMRQARINQTEIDKISAVQGMGFENEVYETAAECDTAYSIRLLELDMQQKDLKNRLRFMENPDIRKLLLESQLPWGGWAVARGEEKMVLQTALVWKQGKMEDLMQFMTMCKKTITAVPGSGDGLSDSNPSIATFPSLEAALEEISVGGTIYVPPGVHYIGSIGLLEEKGGNIIGVTSDCRETIVRCNGAADVLINVFSGQLLIQNLTLETRSQSAIVVQNEATVSIVNCHLVGSGHNQGQGILVLPGGTLKLDQLQVFGWQNGVSFRAGGNGRLQSCWLNGCWIGVHLKEGATLEASGVTFVDCAVALRLEGENKLQVSEECGYVQGKLEDLKSFPHLSLNNITITNGVEVELKKAFNGNDLLSK